MADAAKLLSETIAAYEGGAVPKLPPLRPDPSWWEKDWERWDRWVRDWLAGRLPSVSLPQNFAEAVPYLCAFVIVAVLVAVAVWWWPKREKRSELGGLSFGADGPGDPLTAALAGGRFAEAARWRWKRFLVFRRLAPPTTPREAAVGFAALSPEVEAAERLLFGDPTPTADAYRQWDERLSRWEGPA